MTSVHDVSQKSSNVGKKWTDEEEAILLEELNNNVEMEIIANSHNRNIGGINARCKLIAYKMYNNNISMEEICNITKLHEGEIIEFIKI